MTPTDTGDRRAGLKAQLLERLHDPLQLRILVIGVVLLAGYVGVYMPLADKIAATTQKLSRERKLAELAESLEQLQAQCRVFAKRLPPQTDSKEWMQYMHEGIRRFPLKLARLDCLSTRPLGPYKAIVLQINLEGSFFDLDQFLRWLESNPRLIRVDSINIALAKSKNPGKRKETEVENKDDMVMQLIVVGMAG